MKQGILLLGALCLFGTRAMAQNNVGVAMTTPKASVALDMLSTTQGMLIPRMTKAQRDLIATPATGLLVYQTDNTPSFYFYNGTIWTSLSAGGSGDNLDNHTATQAVNKEIFYDISTTVLVPTANVVNSTMLDMTGKTMIKITNPLSASYTIHGIAGGVHGKVIYIWSTHTIASWIYNSSSETCESCRISGIVNTVPTTGISGQHIVKLIYDKTEKTTGRWLVLNTVN
jgi:hypothetical protein